METMHAAGRRNLPPVPRPALDAPELPGGSPEETPGEQTMQLTRRTPDEAPAHQDDRADDDTAAFAPAVDPAAQDPSAQDPSAQDPAAQQELAAQDPAGDELDPLVLALADEPEHALEDDDPAQHFVLRLRAAAVDFAAAAGAEDAVVREAVPPARHRRSRCRVVLRYPDGAEADLTFLGSVGRPGTPAWQGFDRQIRHWLGTGQQRQSAWLVQDAEAPDGVAVDVPAWLAAG